jgi:MATE family multidrug resistance protein
VVAAIAVGLVLAVILVASRDVVAHWLLTGPEAQASGGAQSTSLMPTLALMLAFAAAVTLFDGLQVVGAMGLRAQGVVWLPTLIHVGSYIVVMLPLCVWLAFGPESVPGGLGLGVWGVFIGISVASVAAGVGQVLALELKSRDAERRAGVEGVAAVVVR